MNYQESVDWLYSQLANYQNTGGKAYKPGLDNIKKLLNHLGNPQNDVKSVHIAGTNGKGSTAHILTSIIIENGYKVGLFTSPHILDFRERVKINGKLISEQYVVDFVNNNQAYFKVLNPSFFEITTALAFYVFSKESCDIMVIETGLGGRLDATNVIEPELSVITNIGLDHTEFLGNSLQEIAEEKGGIIKKNKPVIIGEILPETVLVFEILSKRLKARIINVEQRVFKTDLLGKYQQQNISTAWQTILTLKELGWFFDDLKSFQALTKIKSNSSFKGRLEIIHDNPKIIIDAAHNTAGIVTLFDEIQNVNYENLYCIYGSSKEKNYKESVSVFPKEANYYFASFNSERSLQKADFENVATQEGLKYKYFKSSEVALTEAKNAANSNDLILVFGSFFILEKIFHNLD